MKQIYISHPWVIFFTPILHLHETVAYKDLSKEETFSIPISHYLKEQDVQTSAKRPIWTVRTDQNQTAEPVLV